MDHGVVIYEERCQWTVELLFLRRDASAVDSGVVVTEEERQWTVELLLLRRSASGQWSCCYIK